MFPFNKKKLILIISPIFLQTHLTYLQPTLYLVWKPPLKVNMEKNIYIICPFVVCFIFFAVFFSPKEKQLRKNINKKWRVLVFILCFLFYNLQIAGVLFVVNLASVHLTLTLKNTKIKLHKKLAKKAVNKKQRLYYSTLFLRKINGKMLKKLYKFSQVFFLHF